MNQRDDDKGRGYLEYVIILMLCIVVVVLVLHFLTTTSSGLFPCNCNYL